MGQRKLTEEEMQDVKNAVRYLRRVCNFGCHAVSASIVLDGLTAIEEYGTSDGKPWVEPQPEIGEGYRVATKADKQRQDREMHDVHGRWVPAHVGIHAGNYTYRVPKDRIPTDEDAVGRPMVMVRERAEYPWRKETLVFVDHLSDNVPFLCKVGTGWQWFNHCRFPYPGELP